MRARQALLDVALNHTLAAKHKFLRALPIDAISPVGLDSLLLAVCAFPAMLALQEFSHTPQPPSSLCLSPYEELNPDIAVLETVPRPPWTTSIGSSVHSYYGNGFLKPKHRCQESNPKAEVLEASRCTHHLHRYCLPNMLWKGRGTIFAAFPYHHDQFTINCVR